MMFVFGKIKPYPNLVEYDSNIEDCIKDISNKIDKFIPQDEKYLKRWISLKLIDGDKKIINYICKYFFNKNLLTFQSIQFVNI